MTNSNGQVQAASGSRAYRAGVAVAIATSFATLWSTVVRDDGNGIGFFMVIMAAAVGAFAAAFRPEGMARAMLGVAIMQVLLGVALATATPTEAIPGAPLKVFAFSGVLAALWLVSAAFFRAASRANHG